MNYLSSAILASIKYLKSIGFSMIRALSSGVSLTYVIASWNKVIDFPLTLNESPALVHMLNLMCYSKIGCLDYSSLIIISFHSGSSLVILWPYTLTNDSSIEDN
jgi:hypothetical protein